MAAETFYVVNAVASGSNHLGLQRGGAAPAVATTGTGWTVGTTVAARYDLLDALVERAAATFGSTVLPNAAPNNTIGDCLRTPLPITGSFANANWVVTLGIIAVTNGGSQDGRLRLDVWRGTNATGLGATKLTASVVLSNTVTNLTTATAVLLTLTWTTPGVITLAGEYLFFQLAWEITGAASNANADVLLRTGNVSPSQSRVMTPTLTETLTRTVLATATIKVIDQTRTVGTVTATIAYPGLTRTVITTATIATPSAPFTIRRSLTRDVDDVRYGATGSKELTVPVTTAVKVSDIIRTVGTVRATITTPLVRAVTATATINLLATATRTVTPVSAAVLTTVARTVGAATTITDAHSREVATAGAIDTPITTIARTVPVAAVIDLQGSLDSFDYWRRGAPLPGLRGKPVTSGFEYWHRAEASPALIDPAKTRHAPQVIVTAAIRTLGVMRTVPSTATIYLRGSVRSFDYLGRR